MKKLLLLPILLISLQSFSQRPGIFLGKKVDEIFEQVYGFKRKLPFKSFNVDYKFNLYGDEASFMPHSKQKGVDIYDMICTYQTMVINRDKKEKLIDLFLYWGFVEKDGVFTKDGMSIIEVPKREYTYDGDPQNPIMYELK